MPEHSERRIDDEPVPRFAVTVRTDSTLYWSAHFLCGLADLAAAGVVELGYAPRLGFRDAERLCTLLEVMDRHTGRHRTIAVDWRDNPDLFPARKLRRADLYFKRNLIPDRTYPACPPEHRGKLRPAGLSFAVRTTLLPPRWAQMLAGLAARQPLVNPRSIRRTLYNLYSGMVLQPRAMARLLTEAEFAADGGSRTLVSFRTRAYDPRASSYPDDTHLVSEERAELIRALKDAFGPRFVGGFIPTPYVRRAYPDCLASEETQHSYIDRLKACRVSVYTRGLRDSPAYKLGEYLATSRCIVAQRMKTQLPAPLESERHVLWFESADEAVRRCERLLGDPGLQDRLAAGARAYYQAEVRPAARALALLEAAFADSPGARWDASVSAMV